MNSHDGKDRMEKKYTARTDRREERRKKKDRRREEFMTGEA